MICVEDAKDDMASPGLNGPKPKHPHPSLMVVPKKSRKLRSCKRRMAMMHVLCGQVEVKSSVMERAEAVQANLDSKFPSFVKPMIRSNVTKGFWLSFPRLFCELHLPDHDATIVLMDENQKEYSTKYLVERKSLSAGWRGFSIAHNLVEGDVLVFHMVRFCKMKVYIIRSNHLAEVDAALCLLHLDAQGKHIDCGKRRDGGHDRKQGGEKHQRYFLQEVPHPISEKHMPNNNNRLVMDHPGNLFEDLQLALEA